MNRSMVRYLLSKLLLIEAALLILPLIVALVFQESQKVIWSILATIGIMLALGLLGIIIKPKNYRIYPKEGLLIVSLVWILWSFFGALPFVFSGQIPSLIDAFFEVSSGFTTTGATILNDVSVLTPSLLFWRSFTHLIGGMGVLVFALAIMTNNKNGHHEVMRAEVPGPIFGKLVSRLKDTAQILYIIYLVLFAIFTLILYLEGMPFFDSLIIGMGTAGTGGFTVYNEGLAPYQSSLINYTVAIGMLIFGVNLNLYYLILLRKFKLFFGDEELKTYLIIVFGAVFLIMLNIFQLYGSWSQSFEYAFFQVSTIITTTGYGLINISVWPLFSQFILLILMCLGGSAGSTAGGFKIARAMIISKIAKNQALSTLYPNRLISLHINGQVIDKKTQHAVLKYMAVYLMSILLVTFFLVMDVDQFMTAFSGAISTVNNIGPMLGTPETFAIYSPFNKLLLSFAMIAGRLEIYPILLLFLPKTWSKI